MTRVSDRKLPRLCVLKLLFHSSCVSRVVSALLIFAICESTSGGTVIDSFSSGSIVVSKEIGEATQTGLNESSVIGGERFIQVGEFGASPQTLTIEASSSMLTFETGDTNGYFTVRYGSPDFPLDLDLQADGSNAFALDFVATFEIPRLNITVFTSTGSDSGGTNHIDVNLQPLPNGMTRAVIPFDIYDENLDFGSVDQIELDASRFPRFSTVMIGRFATIPEPTTCALSLATFCLLCRRGRHRHSSEESLSDGKAPCGKAVLRNSKLPLRQFFHAENSTH